VIPLASALALAAQPSKFAQAEQTVSAGIDGRSTALSTIHFVNLAGRAIPSTAFIRFAHLCELDQIKSNGSDLIVSLQCSVKELPGIHVEGGAKLWEERDLRFVFSRRSRLERVVLGANDPLAPPVNVAPGKRP